MKLADEIMQTSQKIRSDVLEVAVDISNMISCFEECIDNFDMYNRESINVWLKSQKSQLIDIVKKIT
jgi:hypothetical protein